MSTLSTPLRRQLENTIKQARQIAESGARKALEALAVHEPELYQYMDEAQRNLRRKLRAQARQLGDTESLTRRDAYDIKHLVEKLAYDQWHRLLFARFLLDNNLLISPEHGVSVSLDDCEELAPSQGLKDAWAVAARFAAKELPQIFRADDPAGAVELPVENRKPLIQLVTGLPVEVFTASDSLGWCYQYWQAERKEEVNATGNKIGADELPAVTQLFTEHYMVDFLLDNTLGAWHAGKILAANPRLAEFAHSEDELRDSVGLPRCKWKYLRFVKGNNSPWTPAAGTFSGWPKSARELKCLDPCMGSGHFVVAMFERIVALRVAEEKLEEFAAVAAVIRDNIFGLEIDPRCTQIGAFNLALAAWRRVGHCKLPAMNLACSGLAPNTKREDWLKLTAETPTLRFAMGALYDLFQKAPILGSLIDPRQDKAVNYSTTLEQLQPLLEVALAQETKDDATREMAVTARGLAKAAEILSGQFTLVATNVPYLGRGKQDSVLQDYCGRVHPEAKADLATCFVERALSFCAHGGSTTLVTPQNWLFLGAYKKLRHRLLQIAQWETVARLGEGGFDSSQAAGAFTVLLTHSRRTPPDTHSFAALDASEERTPERKNEALVKNVVARILQKGQFRNPDARITTDDLGSGELLAKIADFGKGSTTGDRPRFLFGFWELQTLCSENSLWLDSPNSETLWSGREHVTSVSHESPQMQEQLGCWLRGQEIWGRQGVAVNKMRGLQPFLYAGELFDDNIGIIAPHNQHALNAIWCFVESGEYAQAVRRIDQKLNVTAATLTKVPFDPLHWLQVAAKKYPHGLPKPNSSDPTQWLFNGHPEDSDQPLHVAVARLLGYKWPRLTGSSFPDCPALSPDGIEQLADEDGIVCLSATKGEAPAAERLRGLLVKALGKFDLNALIAGAGSKGGKSETLEEWLRDEFFEQHCVLFHQRPFIWHLWDGHKSGFSVLVNYHQLTHANLEKLTYAYLGDWIRRQQVAVDAGEAGSDSRLQAARQLQARLKLILEGEPPYDIFVRWKPLSRQAIGWRPDLNDGVRLNIRPFMAEDIPGGKKGAGLLRIKPNMKWEKDRGKEPLRNKRDFPWFWGWDEQTQDFAGVGNESDGNRWNDCHYTNDFKRKAQQAKQQ